MGCMKKLNVQQMTKVAGGDKHSTYCGIAAGLAVFAPNPFSIAGALIFCLSGDTRR
jgi:hypothetical protein